MQITIEELSSVKKKIRFEVPAERVSHEIGKVYEKIRKQAAVKGFRKGKAPQSYIEKYYSDAMADDVLRNLFNESYPKALMDNKLVPVAHPLLESDGVVAGEDLKFSATVEVIPEIGTVAYEGLQVAKETFVADPAKVEERLQQIRENMAQFVPAAADHAAAQGDMVVIDFEGFIDGVPFPGGKGEDHSLVLGSGSFIPGFEEQLTGLNGGAEADIKVTFPSDYHAKELADVEASFSVTVKEIKTRELPAFDDDFAKEMGDFENMEQLRNRLEETIEKQEKERIESDLREQLVKALVEKNDCEVPQTLVDRQVESMLDGAKKRLESQRMSLAMMGMDDDQYKTQFRDVAEHKVKSSLIMSALARQEGVKVGEADIEQQLKKMSEESGHNYDRLKEFYTNNAQANESLVEYLIDEKVFSLLMEKAEISEAVKS